MRSEYSFCSRQEWPPGYPLLKARRPPAAARSQKLDTMLWTFVCMSLRYGPARFHALSFTQDIGEVIPKCFGTFLVNLPY